MDTETEEEEISDCEDFSLFVRMCARFRVRRQTVRVKQRPRRSVSPLCAHNPMMQPFLSSPVAWGRALSGPGRSSH